MEKTVQAEALEHTIDHFIDNWNDGFTELKVSFIFSFSQSCILSLGKPEK